MTLYPRAILVLAVDLGAIVGLRALPWVERWLR